MDAHSEISSVEASVCIKPPHPPKNLWEEQCSGLSKLPCVLLYQFMKLLCGREGTMAIVCTRMCLTISVYEIIGWQRRYYGHCMYTNVSYYISLWNYYVAEKGLWPLYVHECVLLYQFMKLLCGREGTMAIVCTRMCRTISVYEIIMWQRRYYGHCMYTNEIGWIYNQHCTEQKCL